MWKKDTVHASKIPPDMDVISCVHDKAKWRILSGDSWIPDENDTRNAHFFLQPREFDKNRARENIRNVSKYFTPSNE
jgi:hypothetical protein